MDETRTQFEAVLAEFSETTGIRLELDARDGFTAAVGNIVVSGAYMPASGQVAIWTEVGTLGDDQNAGARALWMLRRHDSWDESRGFTYGMNPETRLLVIADRRSALTISSADALAAWIMALGEEVGDFLAAMDALYPYVDDEPFDEDEPEEDDEPMIREIGPDGKEVP